MQPQRPRKFLSTSSLDGHASTRVVSEEEPRARAAASPEGVAHGADGWMSVTDERGRTTRFRPASDDDVARVAAENGARIAAHARLADRAHETLHAAGLRMARWGQPGGSGVCVHKGSSQVSVNWWYATEAERTARPLPWTGPAGVRARALDVLRKNFIVTEGYGANGALVLVAADNPEEGRPA